MFYNYDNSHKHWTLFLSLVSQLSRTVEGDFHVVSKTAKVVASACLLLPLLASACLLIYSVTRSLACLHSPSH